MKKIDEMKNQLSEAKAAAQKLLDEGKVQEAKAKLEEAKNLKEAIQLQTELDQQEEETLKQQAETRQTTDKTKENASFIRAALKKVTGKALTEAENALLLPSTTNVDGENGEGYILPQDIRTKIVERIRQYRSLRDAVGYMPTGALTGSFPIEDFETVTELIDFTDGTDGKESNDIRFKNVSYSLKEKAAFIRLSNTLLKLTDNALISYVVDIFAKKAVITENKLILAKLKEGKTVKTLADWKALKSSLNKDLDPAALHDTVIVTNQDGFDLLDSAEDQNGRPILQPNPANPTQKLFNGYSVLVYSNSMLASEEGKAPIFYGALKESIKFIDLNGQVAFATSKEAGFMSNTTVARLIEFIDVVQVDSSDKCYIYAEMAIAGGTAEVNIPEIEEKEAKK